jgi:hypothetical protein
LVEHILKPIKPKSTAGTTKNKKKSDGPHHFAPSDPIPLRPPDAAAADRGVHHLQLAGGITQEPNASTQRVQKKMRGTTKKYVIGIIYIYIIYISLIRII